MVNLMEDGELRAGPIKDFGFAMPYHFSEIRIISFFVFARISASARSGAPLHGNSVYERRHCRVSMSVD